MVSKDKKRKIRDLLGKLDPKEKPNLDIRAIQDEVNDISEKVSNIKDYSLDISSIKNSIYDLKTGILEKLSSLPNSTDLTELKKKYLSEIESIETKFNSIVLDVQSNVGRIEVDYKKDLDLLKTTLGELRIEMLSKQSLGGGSMPLPISIAGTLANTPYADINLIAGSNVTITKANNNTKKRTDITFAATGGVTSFAKQGSTALTGAVTLSGGTNVTLTQSGQNIQIASSGGSGTPGGSSGSLQYNNSGAFEGTTFITHANAGVLPSSSEQVTFGRSAVLEIDNDLTDSTSILYLNNGQFIFADDNLSGVTIANVGASLDSDGTIQFDNTALANAGITTGHWNFNTGPVNIGGHVLDTVPLGVLETQYLDNSFGKNTRIISGSANNPIDGLGNGSGSSAYYSDIYDGASEAAVFISSYSSNSGLFYGVASIDPNAINIFNGPIILNMDTALAAGKKIYTPTTGGFIQTDDGTGLMVIENDVGDVIITAGGGHSISITASGHIGFNSGINLNSGVNFNCVGGSSYGINTGQSVGFYGAHSTQPTATTDLITGLVSLGFRAAGTAVPLTTSGTITLSGLTATTPLAINASKQIISGSYSGNTTKVVTNTGTNTSGNLIKWDASGNAVDAGITAFTIGTVSLTSQSADIATTNLATVAGLYRVSYNLQDTTSDLTAGAVTLTISYTDGVGATTATANQVLTGTGRTTGSVYVQLSSGNLTYATSHTGVFGSAKYALYITTERLN